MTDSTPLVERIGDAMLHNLRDRRLLKWLFHEEPDNLGGSIGHIDRPIDLETQREIVSTLAKIALDASGGDERWQPIETAPKDGTLVLLLIDYSGEDGNHWIDDEASGLGRTIGHNGEGQGWQFAGWCWTHDHYVEGVGRAVAWRPLPEPPAAIALTQEPKSTQGEPS